MSTPAIGRSSGSSYSSLTSPPSSRSVNPFSDDIEGLIQQTESGLKTTSLGSTVGNNLETIHKTMSEASKAFQDGKTPPAEHKKKHWWNPLTWFS